MGATTSVYDHEMIHQLPRKPRAEVNIVDHQNVQHNKVETNNGQSATHQTPHHHHTTKFEVSVPPGVHPHGYFQAICNGTIVKVQAPANAHPGQIVHIDLTEATHTGHHNPVAADIFQKYDYDRSNSISVGELREILATEFHVINASNLAEELKLSGVSDQHGLTFDEFQHWIRNVQTRIELHNLRDKRSGLMEKRRQSMHNLEIDEEKEKRMIEKAKEQSILAEETKELEETMSHKKLLMHELEEENENLAKLLQEHEALKNQCKKDTESLQEELKKLREEKIHLEQQKKEFAEESDEFKKYHVYEQRNIEKQRMFQVQEESNHRLIEQMKQEYIELMHNQEEQEEDLRAKQRRKVQEHLNRRKKELED